MISVFDIFKIGIGPSSSHTIGPMKAAKQFLNELSRINPKDVSSIYVDIYGSLSFTGKGHHTDKAIILGLHGYDPDTITMEQKKHILNSIKKNKKIKFKLNDYDFNFNFNPDENLIFHFKNLSLHENGLTFRAQYQNKTIYENTYYSIGGGFIVSEQDFNNPTPSKKIEPYSFTSASQLLMLCRENNKNIYEIANENELAFNPQQDIDNYINRIWDTMQECIDNGLKNKDTLPGPLKLKRRAPDLFNDLSSQQVVHDPMDILDWVNLYAFAVNEENASGGKVVTAPTNGACGIVPSVLKYYEKFINPIDSNKLKIFFLTTTVIGGLYKLNASISGAEVGCQGEVGVACSMAAAGLTALLGGTPEQICITAEIAMEHHLGLTCDPVGGQVQVPCIERNGIGAVKAINSSRMAMRRKSTPLVCLDKVIETMFETGKDMNEKYRETSKGGLAIKVLC